MDNHERSVGVPSKSTRSSNINNGVNNGNRKSGLIKSLDCFSVEWAMQEGGSSSKPTPPTVSLARKVGAEFIGTLLLIFFAAAIAITNPNTNEPNTLTIVAVATGLIVMIVIFSTGHISGAHVNPAVTVAFAALRHFPWRHVPAYIAAQVLGSVCAAYALKGVFHPMAAPGGVTVPNAAVPYGQAFALEFILTFLLMFVTTAVATDTRAVGELAGIAVGATVMLNNFVAGSFEMENDHERVPSAPSTPVTPGTPGAPLFGGFRQDRGGNAGRKSSLLSSCKCFNFEADWAVEEGTTTKASCFSPPPASLARRIGAEFIGTMILIFAGTATAIVNQKTGGSETLIGIAGSNGLAVMIVILSTGHISGAHLNPAITIAFAALKHFPWKYVPVYVCTQVAASLCAAFALKWIFHPIMGGGVTVPSGSNAQAFALEFLITFFLMFVVTAVATDTRTVGELAGIAVGATVMLNILIAGEASGASMNPVRTLGPAVAANNFKGLWVYLTAPFLGALCGAGVYTAVKLPEENQDNQDNKPTRRSIRR